jgi:hypothetical protein
MGQEIALIVLSRAKGWAGTRGCIRVRSGVNRDSLNGSEVLFSHVRLRRLQMDDGRRERMGQDILPSLTEFTPNNLRHQSHAKKWPRTKD